MLQEEQDELARNHQVAIMVKLIKDNMVDPKLKMELNSINARSVAKAMWANDTVTCIDLSSNDLSDHSGSYLARILQRNNSLKKIELDNNRLGPKTCVAFGESLLTNTSLIHLSLDSNPLFPSNDSHAIEALSNALKENKTLSNLNLWRTGMNEVAGGVLASALEKNTTMLICDISHNAIKMSDTQRIMNQLDANLAGYESAERQKRIDDLSEADVLRQAEEKEENTKKDQELAKWLQERRDLRAEERRQQEEARVRQMQEDTAAAKKAAEAKAAEDRKAAEEAAAKKAKKAAKKK
jgi:flagellar biosynthesis GTPase FlhF